MNTKLKLGHWFVSLALAVFAAPLHADLGDALKYLPVQDAGRLKPYDTFAREALELTYGRTKFMGRNAVEVVTTWMLIPDHWDKERFIEIRHSGVREALKLEGDRIHYAPLELQTNPRLALIMQELRGQREEGEKLNPYFQDVQRLENQLTMYSAVKLGMAIRLVPRADSDTWLAVNEMPDEFKSKFEAIKQTWLKGISANADQRTGDAAKAERELKAQVEEFVALARAVAPEKYAANLAIRAEVHYNNFHPFRWSWVAYLLAAILMVMSLSSGRVGPYKWGWGFLGLGLALHTYGMGLRSYLSGRPPVSNMYETVVWVPWGSVVFAMILDRMKRHPILLIASALISVFCLILTDLAPTVLDDSIHPLEPVLRSTFWLTTHVLIITISYAAFFLAFALGDLLLFYYLRDENRYQKEIAAGVQSIYRSIQIGVVLLAAGIILGGVWADYSWGRFWGWDPKETWALIALLGYVAMLHGRLVGWFGNFAMAAGSVLSFSLVIMAWYGVNFVLGAGLHSYGFGAGGVEYVTAFVVAHILFVAYVGTIYRSRKGGKLAAS